MAPRTFIRGICNNTLLSNPMLVIRIKQQKIDTLPSSTAKELCKILKWLISVLRCLKPPKMSFRPSSINTCKAQSPSITNVLALRKNFKWTLLTKTITIKNSYSWRLKTRIEKGRMSTVDTPWCSLLATQKKIIVMEPQQSFCKSRTTQWPRLSTHTRTHLDSTPKEATYRIINKSRSGTLKESLVNLCLGRTKAQQSLLISSELTT